MKSNATAREEVRRFPDRYIAFVKTADGRLLHSSREMRDAFRAHFPILPTSPAFGWLKRLAARVWLLNAKSVMR